MPGRKGYRCPPDCTCGIHRGNSSGKRWTVGPEVQQRLWADPVVRAKRLAAVKRGERNPNWKPKVIRECHYPDCNVEIVTPPSLARVKACCQQHQYIPKNNGSKPYTVDWPRIREAVWERDEYRCVACGRKLKRLECHHLDYDKLNNDFENLVTLCPRCHQGGHRRNVWPIRLNCRALQ